MSQEQQERHPKNFLDPTFFQTLKERKKNDLWREKTELLNLRLCKVTRAKVLLEPEFDTEDQVLFSLYCIFEKIVLYCIL